MLNGYLKLAVQKNGRLTEKTMHLLRTCGLDLENYYERLIVTAKNFELDVLMLRDDDIPEYVQNGVADIGIVGKNIVLEKNADVGIVKNLGFGNCSLMLAVPENDYPEDLPYLNGKRIATSYPNILSDYLLKNGINAKVIEISGSVELAPSLGVADLICDIVSTGNTLRLHKLKKFASVFESAAVLISNRQLQNDPEKYSGFAKLFARIESALNAKNSKYLMMNIPKDSLERIIHIIPSLKSPTILHLADESMLALHAVIPSDKFWEINYELKEAGASGILLVPIENIIL